MASTYDDLITEVREYTQDAVTPFRNDDDFYLRNLNRGLQEIGRLRPDAFFDLYDANSLNVPKIVASGGDASATFDSSTGFQLEMQFWPPLFAYMIGMAEVQDDEFTDEGRASMLLVQFRNTILGL